MTEDTNFLDTQQAARFLGLSAKTLARYRVTGARDPVAALPAAMRQVAPADGFGLQAERGGDAGGGRRIVQHAGPPWSHAGRPIPAGLPSGWRSRVGAQREARARRPERGLLRIGSRKNGRHRSAGRGGREERMPDSERNFIIQARRIAAGRHGAGVGRGHPRADGGAVRGLATDLLPHGQGVRRGWAAGTHPGAARAAGAAQDQPGDAALRRGLQSAARTCGRAPAGAADRGRVRRQGPSARSGEGDRAG